ncbi:MAG: hypothetical protein IIX65_01455 [Lachnospiraceae bacterium]|nr:hypothetical protein [Lachnospiraceae bacterium]
MTRKYGSVIDISLSAEFVVDELKIDCPEYNYFNDWPRADKLILNLQNGNPVYIKFEHATGYHAGVLYGYNSNGNYYILDPQVGPVLGYINSNGYLTYYSVNAQSMAIPFRAILVN